MFSDKIVGGYVKRHFVGFILIYFCWILRLAIAILQSINIKSWDLVDDSTCFVNGSDDSFHNIFASFNEFAIFVILTCLHLMLFGLESERDLIVSFLRTRTYWKQINRINLTFWIIIFHLVRGLPACLISITKLNRFWTGREGTKTFLYLVNFV